MLRACALDLRGQWEDHLSLVEFAYNNNYQSSIQMAPYETLYGRLCSSPLGWAETGEISSIGQELARETIKKDTVIK